MSFFSTKKSRYHFITTPLFAILGRSGGVIILLIMAHLYGATPETDVFFLISGVIVFLAGVFSRFFEAAIIPRIAAYQTQKHRALPVILAALGGAYAAAGLVWVILWISLGPFLQYASGIDPQYLGLSYEVFYYLSAFLFLGITLSLIESLFNSYKLFWVPASSPLIRSVVSIFFMYFGYEKFGIHAISLGYVAGEGARLVFCLLILIRLAGRRFRIRVHEVTLELKLFAGSFLLQIAGVAAVDILPLVDQWFASWLPSGSLSLLNYGDRLMLVADQLFLIGFLQVFLSYWSEQYHQSHFEAFSKRVNRDIRLATLISGGFACLAYSLKGWLVQLCFGRGDLDTVQLEQLTGLFGWLIIGFVPAVVNLLYLRVLFVMKQNRVFFVYSCVQLALKCVSTWFLMKRFGVQGIAMATAVTFILSVVWLHGYIQKSFSKAIREKVL